ncbi:Acyl-CoA N-acyltransferases superfamily protein [Perilla frutescens var. frutescens]|nr:Acyl-CoA N-acyltransferases superfamily protein [Perilla frutescens var. frutescens]
MDPSRITLREFELSDADDVLSWGGDDRVTGSGRWKTMATKDEASSFIEQHCIPHPWRRSICIDGRSIGFVAVLPGSGDERCRGDMGYAIAVEYWGKGITTRAVKMAAPLVFAAFPELVRLQAFTDVENKASQRVLEKAGFSKEGLLRKFLYLKGSILDVVVFSLLKTDSVKV